MKRIKIALCACLIPFLASCFEASVGYNFERGTHIIGSLIGAFNAEKFIGTPATANPLPAFSVPAHPYLADQGRNGMHSDAYATGTYPWSGPLGVNPITKSRSFGWLTLVGGECATVVFDSAGRMISVCSTFSSMDLVLMDPVTLKVLASYPLPPRPSNLTFDLEQILNDTSGGAYFHLLNGDQPILANANRVIQIFNITAEPRFEVIKEYDLNSVLPEGYTVTDAMPDHDGDIWFLTRQGLVGVIDKDTDIIKTMTLSGEEIQNSMAISADGVYIVSDFALYRFEKEPDGTPTWSWRETYDRGTSVKPGAISQGSGTTPTLLGTDYIAIADNADGQINVNAYHRLDGYVGTRLICSMPVFTNNQSVTENSLIGYDKTMIVENNYGYESPLKPTFTAPGVTRIDIRGDESGCDVIWQSNERSQTTVPKLSIGNGLIYLYTREEVAGVPAAQAWYLTTINYNDGSTQYKVLTGTGSNFNNNWAPVTLGPDGTAYVGVFGGIVSIRDN